MFSILGPYPAALVSAISAPGQQAIIHAKGVFAPRCQPRTWPVLALLMFVIQGSEAQSAGTGSAGEETVRGIVSSLQSAEIRVNLRAQVARTPFRTGEAFDKGDTLLVFDCSEQKADVAAAYAGVVAAKSRHDSDREMLKHKAIGQFEVDQSKAKRNEWAAIWKAAKARMKNCVIKAPYDGRVAALNIHVYETPTPEQSLMKIVGSKQLEVQLVVPSTWLRWVSEGTSFTFHVDETDTEHKSTVERVGAEVDAVSRTVEVFGAFETVPARVLPGMSGSARFAANGS